MKYYWKTGTGILKKHHDLNFFTVVFQFLLHSFLFIYLFIAILLFHIFYLWNFVVFSWGKLTPPPGKFSFLWLSFSKGHTVSLFHCTIYFALFLERARHLPLFPLYTQYFAVFSVLFNTVLCFRYVHNVYFAKSEINRANLLIHFPILSHSPQLSNKSFLTYDDWCSTASIQFIRLSFILLLSA